VNKTTADDWPKALLNGVMLGAIMFLSVLPALGWAWHRVLPEHMHIYIGTAHSDADEIVPAQLVLDDVGECLNCQGTRISSGVEHLPGNSGLQVLGIAAIDLTPFALELPSFSDQVILPQPFYLPPVLLPSDPPPNPQTCSRS
jgi:hypothetical protein